jgi:DNA-binding NtrC family response regulator
MPKTDNRYILYLSKNSNLSLFLEQAGYHVIWTHNHTEALLLTRTMIFSLFILDSHFFNEFGSSLCESLRQQHPDIPILLLSDNDLYCREVIKEHVNIHSIPSKDLIKHLESISTL